jgi:hypothetical protein
METKGLFVEEGTAMEREIIRESVKTPGQQPSEETRLNGKPAVRYASDEQFRKAHEKINKTHAGLFRRLAQ